MSKSGKLRRHIAHLDEVRAILNSMKNLALTETHKLYRFLGAQNKSVSTIERVLVDFLSFYPFSTPEHIESGRFVIVLGSERGFCGDFNERLLDRLSKEAGSHIIVLGNRLFDRLAKEVGCSLIKLPGASVVEEAPSLVERLVETIGVLAESYEFFILNVVYHDSIENRVVRRQILPVVPDRFDTNIAAGVMPLLNLPPAEYYSELVDQYLFAVLHHIFYLSLMAENQSRLLHLDNAVKHLDDETAFLHRKSQIFRQEEITEEIEVILLNSENS